MKVAVLAPISSSLYSRLVTQLGLQEKDIEVGAVIVRSTLSISRFRSEFRRDGARLIQKIFNKIIFRERIVAAAGNTLSDLENRINLSAKNLRILCRQHRIPYLVVSNHNSLKALNLLRKIQPDVIAFTGGGLIRPELLSISRLGVLNCHSGILPEYRGMDVVEWPVAEGHPDQVGLTLHFMDAGIDTGPILIQRKVALQTGESFMQLRARMEPMMVELMLEGLRGLRDGTIKPQPQKVESGRQYYVMHSRVKAYAEDRLKMIK